MRLLFVTSTRLGDAVLSTAVLRHFIAQYPGIRITVACGPVAAPIFAAVPGLERVISMPKQKRGGHWWELWKQVASRRWNVIVDLRGSALAYVLLARKRIVLSGNDNSRHRVEQIQRLLGGQMGGGMRSRPGNPGDIRPMVWTADVNEARADALLPDDGRPLLAVGPSANWIGKTWPAERFAAAIAALSAPDGVLPDARVLLVGAPNERDAARPVIETIPENRRVTIFGDEDLLTVMACLKRADLFVGNDSGLMHMAAASGKPVIGLFGPSRDQNYAPYSDWGRVVRTDLSYDELASRGGLSARESLMETLPVSRVIDAATALLSEWRDAQGE